MSLVFLLQPLVVEKGVKHLLDSLRKTSTIFKKQTNVFELDTQIKRTLTHPSYQNRVDIPPIVVLFLQLSKVECSATRRPTFRQNSIPRLLLRSKISTSRWTRETIIPRWYPWPRRVPGRFAVNYRENYNGDPWTAAYHALSVDADVGQLRNRSTFVVVSRRGLGENVHASIRFVGGRSCVRFFSRCSCPTALRVDANLDVNAPH